MLQENTFQREFYDAYESGDIEAVQLLLARGADINQSSDNGSWPGVTRATPLLATCGGHIENNSAVVELLLDRGANINQALPI